MSALPVPAPVSPPLPLVVRPATRADVPGLNALIDVSSRALSVGFYTPEQIDAAVTYVFGVDTGLVDDGTYFVVETEGLLVGCGGWSRRGSRGVHLARTDGHVAGGALYARYGFREVERVTDRMPSGVVLEFVRMRRQAPSCVGCAAAEGSADYTD